MIAIPRQLGFSLGDILVFLLLALAAAMGSYILAARHTENRIREEFALRPPIAVIDIHGFIEREPQDTDPAKRSEAALREAGNAARKLRDAGYLVMESRFVMAAPADMVLPERKP